MGSGEPYVRAWRSTAHHANNGAKFRQMGINKPYYRIIRPVHCEDSIYDYVSVWEFPTDPRYANDRLELWRAYMLIEKDLLRLFEYIEPTDDNLSTYSHRTYELLLRAATEFETNCKRILDANGYRKKGNLTILDYFKINESSKLADYAVLLTVWYPHKKLLTPFRDWSNGLSPLPWYQSYNSVKHDRNKEFQKASLANVLCAVSALYVILFSQFIFQTGLPLSVRDYVANNEEGTISTSGHIFEVMPPMWCDEEIYDFQWEKIKDDPEPFACFHFG